MPVPKGIDDGFGLGMHLQLRVDILQVKIDRAGSNVQLCGSGLVVVAFGQQLQQWQFVGSEIIVGAFGGGFRGTV